MSYHKGIGGGTSPASAVILRLFGSSLVHCIIGPQQRQPEKNVVKDNA